MQLTSYHFKLITNFKSATWFLIVLFYFVVENISIGSRSLIEILMSISMILPFQWTSVIKLIHDQICSGSHLVMVKTPILDTD